MDINQSLNSENIKKSRASRKKGKISIIALVVVVITVAFLIIFSSGLFKSDGQKFLELLTEDQYVVEMFNERKDEFSKDGEREYNLTIKKGILSLFGIPSSIIGQDFILSGNVIVDGKNSDSKLALNMGDTELQSLEIIKEDEITALSIPNLFDEYIAIEDGDVSEVAKKLGYMSGETSKDEEFLDETKKITKKYAKVLAKSINDYIEIEDNVEVNIDEKNFKTKQYKLKLGTNELNSIYLELLKKLKDDDETLEFISANFVESDYYQGSATEILSKEEFKEELKTDIEELYNQKLNEELDEDDVKDEIITIYAYSYKGKNIKNILNLNMKKTSYEIVMVSMNEKEKDYILVNSSDSLGTKIDLKYIGKLENDNYSGELSISSNSASLSLAGINVQKIENSEAKVRAISELNALLLNTATDEELENLKEEIDKNLNGENNSDDDNDNNNNNNNNNNNTEIKDKTPYEEGEFKLDDPTSQVKVLENSIAAYNQLTPGITKEEAVTILGEPSESYMVGSTEYVYWYQGEGIYLVSVGVRNGIVYDVYNDIVSSMKKNVQVSIEVGTNINDLSSVIGNVKLGMTKEEVVNVLGDKYIETNKDTMGYSVIKWYDKKENSVEVEFDSKGKVWYINDVEADK